jgi:RHS repeat-associated protein
VRKVWEHAGLIEERIYLGGWEIYRRRIASSGLLELERETLHLMDGARRVAMVETKTVDTGDPSLVVTPRFRYQLGNHLGSALLEVGETGAVISYEEYHPYGTTAYRSGRNGVEVSAKRYRYTGKERDDETGLYYHGARYYAAWLGRWTAADPAGMVDGANLYAYVRGSPVGLVDPSGRSQFDPNDPNVQRLQRQGVSDTDIKRLIALKPTPPRKGSGSASSASDGQAPKARSEPTTTVSGGSRSTALPEGRPSDTGVPQGADEHHGLGGGGTTSGEGKGNGPGSTSLDDVTAIGGALGMQMPDAAGASGGIPGGVGPASGASALGQAAWLAVSFLWGKAVQGAKALAQEAVPLAKTVASKVERLVGKATTARAVEQGGKRVGAGVDQVARAAPAAGGAGQAAKAIDPNKLYHIFGKAEHKLGPLLQRFGGSQEATFRAVEDATQATVKSRGLSGVFTTTVEVAGQSVTVRGNVIEGVTRIGSFWIP